MARRKLIPYLLNICYNLSNRERLISPLYCFANGCNRTHYRVAVSKSLQHQDRSLNSLKHIGKAVEGPGASNANSVLRESISVAFRQFKRNNLAEVVGVGRNRKISSGDNILNTIFPLHEICIETRCCWYLDGGLRNKHDLMWSLTHWRNMTETNTLVLLSFKQLEKLLKHR